MRASDRATSLLYASHPEVVVDPAVPVPDWGLSDVGRARMAAFVDTLASEDVTRIWSSPERKARDGAAIAAERLGRSVEIEPDLREIDRSATGFVPEPGFDAIRRRFFAAPDQSPDGWERAVDAQRRIVGALTRIAARQSGRPALVIAHGAVGALTLAALRRASIGLELDQPRQGCWFACRVGGTEIRAEIEADPAARWREMPDAPTSA